jgi:hypothetical protein
VSLITLMLLARRLNILPSAQPLAKALRRGNAGLFIFRNSSAVCCIARRTSKVGEPTCAVLVSVWAATLRTIEGD